MKNGRYSDAQIMAILKLAEGDSCQFLSCAVSMA